MFLKNILRCLAAVLVLVVNAPVYAQEWQELKGKHFIVLYNFNEDTSAVREVLRKAEEYYAKIARKIGYSRYSNFWTWEDRVRIVIFPNQQTFMQKTGQPAWSLGYAARDSSVFKTRAIVTYRLEHGFLDELLPHEIGHLILRDFIGFDTPIPVWFEEGVSQLYEKDKPEKADRLMKLLISRNMSIPINSLHRWDIRKEKDANRAMIFYAQSVSLVDFMITKYGSSAFGRLCRSLKEGKSFDDALRVSYSNMINNLDDLEMKWARSMKRQ